ncbi:hypothetical protein HAX54_031891, partial [Datura stramonium]|nr:hypothetical protein [Datura stramonium]
KGLACLAGHRAGKAPHRADVVLCRATDCAGWPAHRVAGRTGVASAVLNVYASPCSTQLLHIHSKSLKYIQIHNFKP